jgi:hypothetical protein
LISLAQRGQPTTTPMTCPLFTSRTF